MSFGRVDVTTIETLSNCTPVDFHVVSPWTELDEGNGVSAEDTRILLSLPANEAVTDHNGLSSLEVRVTDWR
jgi:hypothetical protein